MYAIFIRNRREPLMCDDETGRNIKEQWTQGGVEGMVEIDEATFPLRTIYRVEANYRADKSDERAANAGTEVVRKSYEEHQDLLVKRRKMPLAERAKCLQMAHHVWWAHTGERIPEDIQPTIIARQLAYFKENPNRAWANPTCYRDLVPMPKVAKMESPYPVAGILRGNAMRLVESVLMHDI